MLMGLVLVYHNGKGFLCFKNQNRKPKIINKNAQVTANSLYLALCSPFLRQILKVISWNSLQRFVRWRWRWFLETVCRQGPRFSFWDGNAVFAEILKHIWFWSPPGLFCNYRCMTTAKLLLQTPRAGFKRLQRLPGSSLHFNDWAKFIITR